MANRIKFYNKGIPKKIYIYVNKDGSTAGPYDRSQKNTSWIKAYGMTENFYILDEETGNYIKQ